MATTHQDNVYSASEGCRTWRLNSRAWRQPLTGQCLHDLRKSVLLPGNRARGFLAHEVLAVVKGMEDVQGEAFELLQSDSPQAVHGVVSLPEGERSLSKGLRNMTGILEEELGPTQAMLGTKPQIDSLSERVSVSRYGATSYEFAKIFVHAPNA